MKKINQTFGEAIVCLKAGGVVSRAGWNGKDMYLFVVAAKNADPADAPSQQCVMMRNFIAMKTAQGYAVPWLASQADVLDEDWNTADSVEELLAS